MQEIEAKFYVHDLKKIDAKIRKLNGRLIQARILETNIRFDLPDSKLSSEQRVLRLRRDTEARLTYKDPNISEKGVLSRKEIEFVVEDFEKAKEFLEALGYQPVWYYEKYRTTYEIDKVSIMFDELPYGNFIEIEGENEETIRALSERLQLNWEASIARGYSVLFEQVRTNMNLFFRDLSFANFEGIRVSPDQLQVQPADGPQSGQKA